MTRRIWLLVVPLAIASTTLVDVSSGAPTEVTAWPNSVFAETALLAGEAPAVGDAFNGVIPNPDGGVALLMGGSGTPIPPESLMQVAFDNYAVPKGFGDYTQQILFTPEGLSPIFSGIKSLPLDTSVAQGVTILNDSIKQQLLAGNNVLVGGVSQSATINAIEMQNIANGSLGFQPDPDQLSFLSLGDPSNPNGGLLARFDLPVGSHPSIPSLGITFTGAAAADTGIPADIYTLEYDGFADFPRYPLNLVSDLNAFAGILIVHGQYIQGLEGPGIGVTPEQIANALVLDTTPGYDGGTTYYMMPFDGRLPLAQLIGQIPLVGKPLADLLEPDLTVLANLGYGPDPYIGWSQTAANVATPFGLFPSFTADQFVEVLQALAAGTQKGVTDFVADLMNPSAWLPSLSGLNPLTVLSEVSSAAIDPASFLASLTNTVNELTGAFASAYATLLPTADIVTALVATMPTYDLNIFVDALQAGDLIDAIGLPIAADVGLVTLAGGIEYMVLDSALQSVIGTLGSLF